MSKLNRRDLLGGIGWVTAGSLLGTRPVPGAAIVGREPAHTGALELRAWQRTSSVKMELRQGTSALARQLRTPASPGELRRTAWRQLGRSLRGRFDDLRRHFVFEYYPWYGRNPWRHWQQWDRRPPADVAASSMPALGPYDSTDTSVIEQHARWIADSGAGAINLSWWGRGSYEDRAVHSIMDVMADHDLGVGFHLEPYTAIRSSFYSSDIAYLLSEYGDKRGWDCFLLPRDAAGKQGPVFKSFRTVLPATETDCNNVVDEVLDYTSDDDWLRQTDAVREQHRGDFDSLLLLADSLNMERTRHAGFDGIAIYDNFVAPEHWRQFAGLAAAENLLFSFNCNPGYDEVLERNPSNSCYEPEPFHPPDPDLDFDTAADNERARKLSRRQIRDTLGTTLTLQAEPDSIDAQQGFFLVYINSFNEWHEGHGFEPAANSGDLSPNERSVGYHNPERGDYRLTALSRYLRRVLEA